MEKDNVSHYAGVPSSPLSSNINFDARKDGSWTEVAIKTRKFLQMAAASGQGSTLQGYNNELVKCIEDLREKREELNKLILKDEEDKAKVQKEIALLTDRLKKVNGKILSVFILIFRGTFKEDSS